MLLFKAALKLVMRLVLCGTWVLLILYRVLPQSVSNVKVRKRGELPARKSTSYFEEKHWTRNYLGAAGNSHVLNERRIIFCFHWEIVGIQSVELSSKSSFSGLMLLKPLPLYFSVLGRCDSSRSGAAPILTDGLMQIQCHLVC